MSKRKFSLKTYLSFVKNSEGVKIFRHFYVKNVQNKDVDILRSGELSCAFYVSSVLKIFNLIKEIHCTVDSTIEELLNSGWRKIKKPTPGCILVWEKKDFGHNDFHKHIGFYIGNNKAVSNDYKKKVPKIHGRDFNGKRKVELVLYCNKLRAG